MISIGSYKSKQFNLSNLNGISDQTLEMHFKLYLSLLYQSCSNMRI